MSELRCFKNNNPTNREEKLILELRKNINEVIDTFVRVNFDSNKPITNEMFVVLRDAAMNWSAEFLRELGSYVVGKDKLKEFIEESKKIFIKQIEQ
jgi:hypothetical protein